MSAMCVNCRYFDGRRCVRHAPVIVAADGASAVWPLVKDNDWCGDYEYDGRTPGAADVRAIANGEGHLKSHQRS